MLGHVTKSVSYCVKRVTGVGTRHKEHPILCEESDGCWEGAHKERPILCEESDGCWEGAHKERLILCEESDGCWEGAHKERPILCEERKGLTLRRVTWSSWLRTWNPGIHLAKLTTLRIAGVKHSENSSHFLVPSEVSGLGFKGQAWNNDQKQFNI